MEAKDFAERFTSYRRENGLTQEDVADHLGITKAAVSKWECGHSFPDMALMPEIATLFAVSLDDLFGYSTCMEQSKIDDISQSAITMFLTEPEKAVEYVREQAKAHWSCPGLLHALALVVYSQVPQKPGFDMSPVEGEAYFYASEAERLFERMVQLNSAGSLPLGDIVPYATVLQWLGKGQEAKGLVEPLVSQEPNLAALSFAQLLEKQGDKKEAIRVLQRGLLFSLIESASILQILASLYSDDEEHLTAVYDLGRHFASNPDYRALSAFMLPIITMVVAESKAAHGKEHEALALLREFVNSLGECCDFIEQPHNPMLFDEVFDLMWKENDSELQITRRESAIAMRQAYKNRLTTEAVWKNLTDNAEFREIIGAIGETDE